jgi:hypothetical protein
MTGIRSFIKRTPFCGKTLRPLFPTDLTALTVATGDFNGNAKSDILLQNTNGNSRYGRWTGPTQSPTIPWLIPGRVGGPSGLAISMATVTPTSYCRTLRASLDMGNEHDQHSRPQSRG